MRRALRLMALALTLATSALLAPAAHADPQPPANPQLFFQPGGGSNYLYWDYDGYGSLKVTDAGYSYGVQLISVKLQQNGHTFYGSGVSYSGLLVFSLAGYLFECLPPGYGSYHPEGSPWNKKDFHLWGPY
jgi:hypothetical protein